MWRIAALAGVVTFGAANELQLDRAEAAVFHHLHLGSLGAGDLANIYARLFVPGSIVRGVFWGVEGIEGRRFHLLVSGATVQRSPDAPTALWHFGWGTVSLGESYADHYRREVNWRPPYASLEADFHVHLRSADPRQAAGWYEQALGASVDRLAGAPSTIDAVAAIVRVDGVSLAIHGMPAEERLVSTREGGTADHLAFLVRDPSLVKEAADKALRAPPGSDDAFALDDLPSVFVTAPDGAIVELIPSPRGPGFWHRPR